MAQLQTPKQVKEQEQRSAGRAARRTPVQGRSQETVDRILKAASRLLERMPLEEITTQRIAQESGVSVGGLYRFFPDKQAVIDAIAVGHVKQFEQEVRSRLIRFLPLGGARFLAAVIDRFVEFLDARPDFRTIVFGNHISRATREQHLSPHVGTTGLIMDALSLLLGAKGDELPLKLRIASETGERLLAYAYQQENASEKEKVISELKKLLNLYFFSK